MTRDYGQRGEPRYAYIWRVGQYAFIVAAIALAAAMALIGLQSAANDKAYWEVLGPPCPVLSRAAFGAQTIRLDQAYDFDGVVFTRAYGWMLCGQQGALHICQFTNPAIVKVTMGKREIYFAPGVGKPATVSERGGGEPRCVIGANFSG